MAHELRPSRARIGLIIPSSNRLTEEQFNRYAPPDVHVHVTRLRMTGPHRTPVPTLLPRITEAAELLADARCDIIVFHCTASSMEAGLAVEREVISAIERATGQRAATTASALVAALHALGARRLVLISPYLRESHEHELVFLQSAGFEVVRDRAMEMAGSDEYVAAPPSLWSETAVAEADPRADAVLLSCTNIRSAEVVQEIEARLGQPVVTSNQATLWYCLRACGVPDGIPGLGRLCAIQECAPVETSTPSR